MTDANLPGTRSFGERLQGCAYRPRPGAYAIVRDASKRVATIRSENGHCFLPGGGIEPGESAEQALARELLEECGWTVHVVSKIGDTIQYVHAEGEGFFVLQCNFYNAVRTGGGESPVSQVEWLYPHDAMKEFQRECDAWAVSEAASSERS